MGRPTEALRIRGKNSKLLVVLLVVASLITAVAVVTSLFSRLTRGLRDNDVAAASRDLPAAVAAYRKTGMPWTLLDLAPDPPVPPDRNAAAVLYLCEKQLEADKASGIIDRAAVSAKRGEYELAGSMIEPLREPMLLATKAARLGRADYKHDWDLGPNVECPELSTLRNAARLLAVRAEAEASKGEVQAAVEDLRSVRRLAGLTGQSQLVISLLEQAVVGADGVSAEQVCASLWAKDPKALRVLSELEDQNQDAPDLSRALRSEAYLPIAVCRNLDAFGGIAAVTNAESDPSTPPLDPRTIKRDGLPTDSAARANMDRVLRFWTDAAPILSRYKSDPRRLSSEFSSLSALYSRKPGGSYVMLTTIPPVFDRLGDAVAKLQAERLVTQALVKALSMHAETGRYPKSLGEIPGTWIDPFTDKPLHLIVNGNDIRIYSTGATEVDHGGITSSELPANAPDSRAFDIVAAYSPPKPRLR